MVAEDLLVLRDPRAHHLFEPVGELHVEKRAKPLRGALVGGVADEEMLEPVRRLTREARLGGPDEVLRRECLEVGVDGGAGSWVDEGDDRAAVEDLALDRAPFERCACAGLERVEARAEECVEARRQGERVEVAEQARAAVIRPEDALVTEHRDELLEEERVPSRRCREPRAQRRRCTSEHDVEQPFEVLCAEGLQSHRRVPVRTHLESSGRASPRTMTGAVPSADGRPARRSSNVGSAHWMSSTITTSGRSRAPAARKAAIARAVSSAVADPPATPSSCPTCAATADGSAVPETCVSSSESTSSGECSSLTPASSRAIWPTAQYVIPSPYERHVPRTTRARVPIRETSSATRRDLPTPGSPRTVARRAAPDATTSSNTCSRRSRCSARPVNGVAGRPGDRPEARDLEQAIRGHRLGLPLRLERLDRLDAHCVAHEAEGRLAEQHVAGAGGLLEPRSDVDRVAGHERLAARAVARDDLAGVDADPQGDARPEALLEILVQGTEARLHLQCGAARAQRIVLVRLRDAEDREDGVADELLHRAAVTLERAAHLVEVGEHQAADRLRIEALAHRGRARQVTEDKRRELPALRVGGCEGGAAVHAEARLDVDARTTAGTDHARDTTAETS